MCFGDPVYLKERLKLSDKQIQKISNTNKRYERKFLDIKEKIFTLERKADDQELLFRIIQVLNSLKS